MTNSTKMQTQVEWSMNVAKAKPEAAIQQHKSSLELQTRYEQRLAKMTALLAEKQERLEQLIGAAPIGMVIHQNERIVYANHMAADIMRVEDASILLGQNVYDFVDETYHDISRERMSRPSIGKTLPLYRLEFLRRNGERTYAEVASQHIEFKGSIATMVLFMDVSERVQKEQKIVQLVEQLAASEAQYRVIADNSDGMIGILDPNGVVHYASPSHERVLGFAPAQLEGRLSFEKVHPGDVSRIARQFSDMVAAKTEVDVEWRYLKSDGGFIWVEAHGTPILDDDNQVTQVLVVARDISERKAHEQKLRQSEEKYRLISENSIDLILTINRSGVVTYASPSFERVLGLHPETMEACVWFDFVDPLEVPMMVDKYEDIVMSREPLQVVFHYQHTGGPSVPVEADIIPILTDDGDVNAFLCIARDIRSRIEVQRTLEENEKRYGLIAKNSTDLIRLVDAQGIITFASPSHQTLLGADWQQFLGQSYLYGVYPDDISALKSSFESTFTERQAFTCEHRRRRTDGSYLWLESTGTPVFDELQNITEIVMVSRDITERKQHEERLEFLALHDSLTGLPNRRLFSDRTKQTVTDAKRSHHKFAVLFIDCDHFKNINDTYGHDVGDAIIREFGRRIRASIRESDTVARLGGDEFIVLLPRIEAAVDAVEVAERILQATKALWQIGDYQLTLTVSIGIAVYPVDGENVNELVKNADEALYMAKSAGKNTYRCYGLGVIA